MSQRKALIASMVITLVLALSAIGIRAAFVDSPGASADPQSGVTLVAPGSTQYDDNEDRYEGSHDESGNSAENSTSNHDDDDHEEYKHEEEHDDDEH